MNGIVDLLRLQAFGEQAERIISQFPREIMLAEGVILVALGVGFALFLLMALVRRKGLPAIAASLAGMAFLIEAMAFGRLGVLPEGAEQVLLGFFLASVFLFLTGNIRAARENVLLGAVLLAAIVAAIGLGIADYLGFYDSAMALRLFTVALAVFAVGLSVLQAFARDRRAVYIAPGIMLAAASLAGFLIAGMNGLEHWSGYVIPHGMFAGGVLLACLTTLFPADTAQPAENAPRRVAEPVMASAAAAAAATGSMLREIGDDEDEAEPQRGKEELRAPVTPPVESSPAKADDKKPSKLAARVEPAQPTTHPEPPAGHQSPISALWGHKHASVRQAAEKAADGKSEEAGAGKPDPVRALRTALGTQGRALWDWRADGQINASEETASLFGVGKVSRLTPETIRELIVPADLGRFDEEILGGSDPETGRFDFTVGLHEGRRLSLKGERQVDAEGLVARIVAFIAAANGAGAGAGPIDADAIRHGLAEREFEAWFQPVVRLEDEEIAGFEALARWRRDGGKEALAPDRFMDTAIEAGLEFDIAATILQQAAAELAAWISAGPAEGQFVSFNVTAETLLDDRLVQMVRTEIKRHSLPRGALVVELTESQVVQDQARAIAIAKSLRQAGARIAIDDLGAGQNSLNQLSRFRFDIIKTDRTLLDSAIRDEHGATLLGGLVDMAHKMGSEVVAEGIQSAEGVEMLRRIGCDYTQGYYYGRPEPAGGAAPQADDQDESVRNSVMAELR